MDEYKFDISDRSSRNSCFCSGTGAQACGQRGAGISCQVLSGLILVLLWVIPYILELFRSIQELFTL